MSCLCMLEYKTNVVELSNKLIKNSPPLVGGVRRGGRQQQYGMDFLFYHPLPTSPVKGEALYWTLIQQHCVKGEAQGLSQQYWVLRPAFQYQDIYLYKVFYYATT